MPKSPGVYRFLDAEKNLLYVGKAKDLRSRVSSYFTNTGVLGEKTRVMVSQVAEIEATIVESEIESLLLEAFLIKKFQPKYNIRMTDGKSYPLIQITGDTYPAVLFARKPDDAKSSYFGPFPNSGSVKKVLRLLRKAFPYVSVRNHPKRTCLYHHLGLCPCPPVYDTEEARRVYRKNIKKITAVLEGRSQVLLKELQGELRELIKSESYEGAQSIQKQIDALTYITQPFHQGFEYDLNPNLRTDLRQAELDALAATLRGNGLDISSLEKIECYDISHVQGSHTTASMVVFVGGEKASDLYRKFKIRLEKTPDDFASMDEVLTRRLKHAEWEYPGLFVVDGGKGQVSAALAVLAKHNLTIPLIGLAKREETIIIPNPDGDEKHFTEVSLSKESPALLLLRRIRDEAHRFAISYHRTLRSRKALESN